eukprot:2319786-Heterocapsa_arctica.AAC.1
MEIIDEHKVLMVQETCAPWHDDLTGEILDDAKVKAAMQKERDSIKEFCVYDRVPQEQVPAVWADEDATVVKS